MIGKEPLSTILYPFSLLYGVASSVKNHLYDTGVLSQYTTSIPVICVGNITVGGSGKSPVVQMIVSKLLSQGKRPVILSRGYGGSERGPIEVKEEHLASAVGDEPLMHKKHFRQTVSVVVARKRAHGAQFIEEKSLGDIIVLDDGYQHRALNRAVNILLIDRSSKEKEHLWRKKTLFTFRPI